MKIYVETDFKHNSVEVFVQHSENPERKVFLSISGDELLATPANSAEFGDIKPFIKLPRDIFNDFVKEIQDYAQKSGIPPKQQSYLEGKLEATERHLAAVSTYLEKMSITPAPVATLEATEEPIKKYKRDLVPDEEVSLYEEYVNAIRILAENPNVSIYEQRVEEIRQQLEAKGYYTDIVQILGFFHMKDIRDYFYNPKYFPNQSTNHQ